MRERCLFEDYLLQIVTRHVIGFLDTLLHILVMILYCMHTVHVFIQKHGFNAIAGLVVYCVSKAPFTLEQLSKGPLLNCSMVRNIYKIYIVPLVKGREKKCCHYK